MDKWPFLDQNHRLIPSWKMSIFLNFWTSCFHFLETRLFVLEYLKRYFPGLHCLKKKVWEMTIFGPKPWVNPLGKMSIFSTFWTTLFLSLKRCLFVLKYRKRHFPSLLCPIKEVGEMAIFGPIPCVNPFGKMSLFSTFWTSCFHSLKGGFIVL